MTWNLTHPIPNLTAIYCLHHHLWCIFIHTCDMVLHVFVKLGRLGFVMICNRPIHTSGPSRRLRVYSYFVSRVIPNFIKISLMFVKIYIQPINLALGQAKAVSRFSFGYKLNKIRKIWLPFDLWFKLKFVLIFPWLLFEIPIIFS